MAQEKKSALIPGVAAGKHVVGVPIDDGLSIEDRVNTFIAGAIGGDVYEVSAGFGISKLPYTIRVTDFVSTGLGLWAFPVWPAATRLRHRSSPWPGGFCLHGRSIALQPTREPTRWVHLYYLRYLHDDCPGADRAAGLLAICRRDQNIERYISSASPAGGRDIDRVRGGACGQEALHHQGGDEEETGWSGTGSV